jgi:hypothetical protein
MDIASIMEEVTVEIMEVDITVEDTTDYLIRMSFCHEPLSLCHSTSCMAYQ